MENAFYSDNDFATIEPPSRSFEFETPPESVKFCEKDECEIVRFTASRCIIRHVVTTENGAKIVFWEKAKNRTHCGVYVKPGESLKFTRFVYI